MHNFQGLMLVVSFVSGIYIPNALPTFPPEIPQSSETNYSFQAQM